MILLLSAIPYDGLRQRPQQLADRLGAVYVSPWTLKKSRNKRVFLLPYNAKNPLVRWIARKLTLLRFVLGWFAASRLPNADLIIVQSYHWYPVIRWMKATVIYDRIDNEDAWFSIPKDHRAMQVRADAGTCSDKNLGGRLIRNGVDTSIWQRRVVVSYHGVVDWWFDTDLLLECAKAISDVTFLIVGPVKIEVPRWNNIVYTGEVPHESLPAILQSVSVGIIPFKVNALTATVQPVKLEEYHALGIPVLATRFNTLDCCTASRELFSWTLRGMLGHGRCQYEVQTWDKAADEMKDLIDQLYHGPWRLE